MIDSSGHRPGCTQLGLDQCLARCIVRIPKPPELSGKDATLVHFLFRCSPTPWLKAECLEKWGPDMRSVEATSELSR